MQSHKQTKTLTVSAETDDCCLLSIKLSCRVLRFILFS